MTRDVKGPNKVEVFEAAGGSEVEGAIDAQVV